MKAEAAVKLEQVHRSYRTPRGHSSGRGYTSRLAVLAVAAAAAGAASPSRAATQAEWVGPVNGNWTDPTK